MLTRVEGVFVIGCGLALALSACSAAKDSSRDIVGLAGSGGTAAGASGTIPGSGANTGTFFPDDGTGGTEGQPGTLVVDPCTALGCGPGQRCESSDTGVVCVDNSCEELACAATEECRADARGGNICVNLFCEQDVDCVVDDFCSDGTCRPDVCAAGTSSCVAAGVSVCASNGGGEEVPYACGSAAYFASTCDAPLPGSAACTCEDDWDCPAFTSCEVGRCVGTGFAPSCTLPPTDFRETAPAVEIHWGGDSTLADAAHDGSGDGTPAPWAFSSHVQATPMVANLDDDNGDGLINELDFPEIIFVTYTALQDDNTGVLRAIHGGGPRKGRDYFARCGNQLWVEGQPLPPANTCNGGDGRSRAPAAVADLTGDGVPEIVQVTVNNGFRILDNTGALLIDRPNQTAFTGGGLSLSPSIANLDFQGLPELIFGSTVFMLDLNAAGQLFVSAQLNPPAGNTNGENDSAGPMSCVADLSPSPGQEILAGPTLYRLPAALPACATPPCAGTLQVVWSGNAVNAGASALAANLGLCAVADVWGADPNAPPGPANPPDGEPEAIFIANGNLIILEGATGALIDQRNLGGGPRGGAPNVDDFDGDGFLEIASALSDFYVVVDLQEPTAAAGACPAWPTNLPRAFLADQLDNPNLTAARIRDPGGQGAQTAPSGAVLAGSCGSDADCDPAAVCNTQAGRCVCLHNGWQRASDDNSSRATSSSVFDFNGDGAAEVLYNDECEFRVFDGVTGAVLFADISRSRTWTENPVVADVDNDGNAEVVTVMNTERENQSCNDDPAGTILGPNGLRVWGDPGDTWVSARRIYNQQSYHVTNVTEAGTVPLRAPESWRVFNGKSFNTYRSQPRSFGAAPDLVVEAVGIFSPDSQCGTLSNVLNVTFEVKNAGDLRVGAGVPLSFEGEWNGSFVPLVDAEGAPLSAPLATVIEPGRSVIATTSFDIGDQPGQTGLPSSIRVRVDAASDGSFGTTRECNEANNERIQPVEAGNPLPDLRLSVGTVTPVCAIGEVTVPVSVSNNGAIAANNALLQLYAGDPTQGGTVLFEQRLDMPIPPLSTLNLSLTVGGFPRNRQITVYGAIDPNNEIAECNEGDNTDPADNAVRCADLR